MEELLTSLLAELKLYLNITESDDDNDKKLKGSLKRGISRLLEIAGATSYEELKLTEENQAKSLLLNYCFYDINNVLNEFETTYISELQTFHYNFIVKVGDLVE